MASNVLDCDTNKLYCDNLLLSPAMSHIVNYVNNVAASIVWKSISNRPGVN